MKGKILVFAALAALVSCGNKKSEQEKEDFPCKVGKYVYISGDLHVDRNCPYAFSNAKFVRPTDLTRDMIELECGNRYCRMCIDDEAYDMLQTILYVNERAADSSEVEATCEYE